MDYLDLEELAKELDDLEDMESDDEYSLDDAEKERLAALRELDNQFFCDMSEYARNEPTLIPELEFEDYCKEFAEDVGYVERKNTNPLFDYIDWERWADDCKMDYMEVEFEGFTYLIRAY